jgi:hypothetical protein
MVVEKTHGLAKQQMAYEFVTVLAIGCYYVIETYPQWRMAGLPGFCPAGYFHVAPGGAVFNMVKEKIDIVLGLVDLIGLIERKIGHEDFGGRLGICGKIIEIVTVFDKPDLVKEVTER